jgi:hypothetical protein
VPSISPLPLGHPVHTKARRISGCPAIVSTAATTTREDLSEDAGNHGLCDGEAQAPNARGFFLMGNECGGG